MIMDRLFYNKWDKKNGIKYGIIDKILLITFGYGALSCAVIVTIVLATGHKMQDNQYTTYLLAMLLCVYVLAMIRTKALKRRIDKGG